VVPLVPRQRPIRHQSNGVYNNVSIAGRSFLASD
jgi:hypothetical protein